MYLIVGKWTFGDLDYLTKNYAQLFIQDSGAFQSHCSFKIS